MEENLTSRRNLLYPRLSLIRDPWFVSLVFDRTLEFKNWAKKTILRRKTKIRLLVNYVILITIYDINVDEEK